MEIAVTTIPHTVDGHQVKLNVYEYVSLLPTNGVSINAIPNTKSIRPKNIFVSELLILIFCFFFLLDILVRICVYIYIENISSLTKIFQRYIICYQKVMQNGKIPLTIHHKYDRLPELPKFCFN